MEYLNIFHGNSIHPFLCALIFKEFKVAELIRGRRTSGQVTSHMTKSKATVGADYRHMIIYSCGLLCWTTHCSLLGVSAWIGKGLTYF